MPITDYYVASDAMGSITAILDDEGNVLERRTYDVFGKMTCMAPDGTPIAASPTGMDVGFQGQIRDEATGLYQMGYRWYNPVLGRWISQDPIGKNGGTNVYKFCNNAPIIDRDPLGLVAYVTVEGDEVTIELPITYRGKGATPKRIAEFDAEIEKCWTGKFGKYRVKTKVTKRFDLPQEKRNIIEVPSKVPSKQAYGFINANESITGVISGDPAQATPWTAAHEAGHLMKLPDLYIKPDQPSPDAPKNIMNEYGGTIISEAQIEQIIRNNPPLK